MLIIFLIVAFEEYNNLRTPALFRIFFFIKMHTFTHIGNLINFWSKDKAEGMYKHQC